MKKVDILKFVMSFLVIFIHVSWYYEDSICGYYLTNTICRFAVPFFLICTGYFCNGDFLKTIKRLLILYTVWVVIYFSTTEAGIRALLFDGLSFHMWYITYSIWGLILLYFLLKVLDIKKVMGISFILYFLPYCMGINTQFLFTVFVLSLGIYMRDHEIKMNNIWMLIISLIFLILEIHVIKTNFIICASLIPGVVAIFNLAKNGLQNNGLRTFRNLSTVIYFCHVYVLRMVVVFVSNIGVTFLITAVVSFIISVIVVKGSECKYCKVLKLLY